MYFKEDKYKKASGKEAYHFPDYKRKKDSNFFLQFFEAMYSDYLKDKGGLPYSRQFDYGLYRLYAEGNQPTEKYMDFLCPLPRGKSRNEDREGWMNISWDIVSVLPKIRRIFIGKFEKIEHDVICTAINDKALSEKEDFKWKLWAEKELAPFFQTVDSEMGVEAQTPEWLPENMQELEMFMSETFKLKTEIAMEMGIEYAFYLSQWPEVKKRMLADWFDLGVAACRDYVDPIDNKVKCKYIDPAKLIIRYSRDPQFSNIDYWGVVEEWTIAELRQKSGFDEKIICNIAHSYNNWTDNLADWDWDYYNFFSTNINNANSQLPYDNFKVNVMFGEFITSESKKIKTVKLKNGATKMYEDEKVPQDEWVAAGKEGRSVDSESYQCTMSGYWVVGTEHVFECGKSYVQPRPDKKIPRLSINAYKYSNKSILASTIPNIDNFQLAWLKLQNAEAMASPAGLAIDVKAMESVSIDGKTLTPLEIMVIRRGTGDTLYASTDHFNETNRGIPITETEGGIGRQLNEFTAIMEQNLKMIANITGINESIDASSPKERTAVGTSQMAASAANDSLQPIYSGYTTIKEEVAKKMVSRYQTLAAKGKLKGYYPSLGSNVVKIFEMGSETTAEEYAIKMKVRPTDEMKQAIRQAALEAQKLGKKQGGITHSDYIYIEEKIADNQLKYAWLYLNYKEKQYEKEAQKVAQANIQGQGEQQKQLEAVKIQSKQAEIEAEKKAKIEILSAESQLKMKEEAQRHQNKLAEIAAMSQGKHENEVIKGVVKNQVEQNSPEKK